MSIQERNRYKKEIDILIDRLHILQEQEKAYNDLSKDIETRKKEILTLKKTKEDTDILIKSKLSVIDWLYIKNKQIIDEGAIIEKESKKLKNITDKERDDYISQREIYNNFLDKINTSIEKSKFKEKEFKHKMLLAQKEHDNAIDLIKRDKWDLFENVLNNEKALDEQKEKWQGLKKLYTKLKEDYKELDKEYQVLLENYILKI